MELQWIFYGITVFNLLIITFMLITFKKVTKFIPNIQHILTMWGKGTVQARWDKVRSEEQVKMAEEAKKTIAENVKKKVPMGLADGLDSNHMFALIGDPEFLNFVKGLGVLGNIGVSAVQAIANRLPHAGEQPEKQQSSKIGRMS